MRMQISSKYVMKPLGEHNFIADICHSIEPLFLMIEWISENHNHIAFYAKEINEVFAQQKNIGEDPVLDGFWSRRR